MGAIITRLTPLRLVLSMPGELRGDELQTIECEVGINRFDELRFLTYEGSLTAGADDAGARTEFLLHPRDDPVHQSDVAIEQPALHAGNGGTAYYVCRLLNLDAREFSGVFVE